MSLLDDFRRVTRARPCPVCEHADWCLLSREDPPSHVICARVESARRWGEAGWHHQLRADQARRRTREIKISPAPRTREDLEGVLQRWRGQTSEAAIEGFAAALGIPCGGLQRLRVSWTGSAWAFPMSDANGHMLGIRLRRPDGGKFSVRGGNEGLFLPTGLLGRRALIIAEGPTDTAALLGLGFECVGRPSCTGGVRHLVALVARLEPSSVVIAADADAPGVRGAWLLAGAVACHRARVHVLQPPAGLRDVREWVRSGATPEDVFRAIELAEPVRVVAQASRRGGRAWTRS